MPEHHPKHRQAVTISPHHHCHLLPFARFPNEEKADASREERAFSLFYSFVLKTITIHKPSTYYQREARDTTVKTPVCLRGRSRKSQRRDRQNCANTMKSRSEERRVGKECI